MLRASFCLRRFGRTTRSHIAPPARRRKRMKTELLLRVVPVVDVPVVDAAMSSFVAAICIR
jgi:hypothetical protein